MGIKMVYDQAIETVGSVWVDHYSIIENIVKPEGVFGTIGKPW